MKKQLFTFIFAASSALFMASCSTEVNVDELNEELDNLQEEVKEEKQEEPQEEVSALGNFEALVGDWTVDAAIAGVKMDLTFNEDGTLKQNMGTVSQTGTWEVIDDSHLKVATENSKGQTWKVTELTEDGVNICWNPDSSDPKTIPMQRVK